MEYAIIGGTGVYDPKLLSDVGSREVETPYGRIVVETGTYQGVEVAFLPRHGKDHSVPPHKINYRANIWGLKALGVKRILATAAVGSTWRNVSRSTTVARSVGRSASSSCARTAIRRASSREMFRVPVIGDYGG